MIVIVCLTCLQTSNNLLVMERSVKVPHLFSLSDFVVDFCPEVHEFFNSRLGSDEFAEIRKLACQAPP